MHSLSLKKQMGIPPDAPREAVHITFGQIHTSDEAYPTIYYHHLPMVTVIHLTGKQRETHFQEASYLNAGLTHLFKETIGHVPASDVIIEYPYLYPLTRLVYQYIPHHTPDGIVFKNIKLQMNVPGGPLQLPQEGLQHGAARSVDFYPVSIERQRLIGIAKKRNETSIGQWKRTGSLGHVLQHRFLLQAVIALLADEPFMSLAASEKEIEHQSDNREEQ